MRDPDAWLSKPQPTPELCRLYHGVDCRRCFAAEEQVSNTARALAAAHRKIGEARSIVEAFWDSKASREPYSSTGAWAAHVALVRLAAVLKRGAKP